MTTPQHSHVEIAQLGAIVRSLIETMETQAEEVRRLGTLVEQQTNLRDQPSDFTVVSSELSALHQRAQQLVDRLEEKVEAG